MESISDTLKHLQPSEPPEFAAIKAYIAEHFQAPASVALHNDRISITVASAALANSLRLRLPQLQQAANTSKRLLFRVGPVTSQY